MDYQKLSEIINAERQVSMDSGEPVFGGDPASISSQMDEWENMPLSEDEVELPSTEQCEVSEKSTGFYEYLKDLEFGSNVAFFAKGHEANNYLYTGFFKKLCGRGSGIAVILYSCTVSLAGQPRSPQELDPDHECVVLIDRIVDIISVRKKKLDESSLEDVRKLDLD